MLRIFIPIILFVTACGFDPSINGDKEPEKNAPDIQTDKNCVVKTACIKKALNKNFKSNVELLDAGLKASHCSNNLDALKQSLCLIKE